MKPNCLVRVVSLLVLASAALTAQVARQGDVAPLKNWATPLSWQPNQAEREAAQTLHQGAGAQLVFSANAVSTDALTFVAITPCRLVDTRGGSAGFNGIAPFSGPSLPAAETLTIPVQSPAEASANTTPAPCGVIPSIAQAYSFNLTVVPAGAPSVIPGGAVDYVSLWAAGSAQPFVSTLDDPQGLIVSNAAIVPAGTPYGGINIYNSGPSITGVVVDMNGYFAAPTDLSGNTALGMGTLASNTTGTNNTASGFEALEGNTAGAYNTASGFEALQNNTAGNGNTASGGLALQNNTSGNNNTASGAGALQNNTTGNGNTASGLNALQGNTLGNNNTAGGLNALAGNTTGNNNTASGQSALQSNTSGVNNTASGQSALQSNTLGVDNTASGQSALQSNTTGANNTASGQSAMLNNTTGANNTASGQSALQSNTTGAYNTASGQSALLNNTTGSFNAASGQSALQGNTTGAFNTASGQSALQSNTTGNSNIAIGNQAALNVSGANSNNIHIGNQGAAGDGTGANNGVIRIGTDGAQTSAYIAGIFGVSPTTPHLLVCVDGNGMLGTSGCLGASGITGSSFVPSSLRFKEQVADMGDGSSKLLQLRPVTFFYKPQYDDGSHLLQYGLIAEEVAKLYPEMVGYDQDGRPSSVSYQSLAPMLLNEVQKQEEAIQLQQEQNRKLEDRLAVLEDLLSSRTSTPAPPASSR